MITQDAAQLLLIGLRGMVNAMGPVDPKCWACHRKAPGEHSVNCIYVYCQEAIAAAAIPANDVAQQLQQASKLFAEMAADASIDKATFKAKYGPMMVPMFQGLGQMLGGLDITVPPLKPN